MKSDKHIEIVRSAINGFSSMSQESAEAALVILAKNYTKARISIINGPADLEALVQRKPDLVFIGMECIPLNHGLGLSGPGRIWLAQYLDEHGIAYTGSTRLAHELSRNKALAKQQVLDSSLATSPFTVIKHREAPDAAFTMALPLFVKPANRGGGVGIDSTSVVHDRDQLRSKVQALADSLGADSLVEEYLPGREFSVAILKNAAEPGFSIMPLELIAPVTNGVRLLSEDVKSANAEEAIEVTDKVIKLQVEELALDVFFALGARDYGRVDIRLDKDGVPHFLEANLIPSLISGYGSFPKACALNIGLGYEAMIMRIAGLGLSRQVDVLTDDLVPSIISVPIIPAEPAFNIV